ncbi:tetratricopeptide repeat protein [Sulfurimonas sp.]|uniref:tetratricopeptide repeat protein n=1 Tax=Sulfurimonas sp. TaxID=2022749 RepID=UPI002B46F401|nr:tetratricopeptide repeat protein [Sulfurimonas sp.]
MKYKLLKLLFLASLFIGQSAYAIEPLSIKYVDPKASEKADSLYNEAHRLSEQGKYEKAIELYKSSYEYKISADVLNNLAATFEKIKDYDNAIKWYRKAINEGSSLGALNLGLLFDEKLSDIKNAKVNYQIAYNLGNSDAAYNLALLYEEKLHDIPNAIKWYKKAIQKGHISAIKNLGYLYRTEKKDNLLGSAYMIGLIDKKYSKEKVFDYLRNTLKIDEPTLKKAYELQKTLVPNPYTGGIE